MKVKAALIKINILFLVMFVFQQLVTDAILTSKAAELELLDREREELSSQNMRLNQEISKSSSFTLVEHFAKDQAGLKPNSSNRYIYVEDYTVYADR